MKFKLSIPVFKNNLKARICAGLTVTGLIAANSAYAQSITCPDTVTVGTDVSFSLSGSEKFITYAWEFGSNTFKTLLTTPVAIPNTGTNGSQFDIAASPAMVYDHGTKSYYGFVTCASSGFNNPNVQRIDFGADPNNPAPGIVNLGNPGNAFINNSSGYHNMQDFKVVKDNAGTFHAFINNGGVVHWIFGNGIDNPPTQSARIFTNPSVLGMSINMAVVYYNGNWYIFTGQAFGAQPGLVRLNLGPDLNAISSNIPYHAFPTVSNIEDASYLAILKENGNWYINMCADDGNASMMRYSFGTNLTNNNPTISDLGASNAGGIIKNRGLNYLKTCDSTTMIGIFQDGTVYAYDYMNNSVVNPPIPDDLGQKFGGSVAMQNLSPYWYKDTLWALSTDFNNNVSNTVYRFPLAAIDPGNTTINYYSPTASHVFNTAGIFDVELYCDQGDNRGPQSFCKQIVVVEPTAIGNVGPVNNGISIYPNPAINELHVTVPEANAFCYSICDITGRKLFSASVSKQDAKDRVIHVHLNNHSLNAGLYILNLFSADGKKYTARFIKQ